MDTRNEDRATSTRQVFVAGGVAVAAVLLLALLWFAGVVFILFFAAILIAVFLRSLASLVRTVTRLPYGVALAVTVLLVAGGLVMCGWFFGTSIAGQAAQFVQTLRDAVSQLQEQIRTSPWGERLISQIHSFGNAASHEKKLLSAAAGIFSSTFEDVVDVVVTLVAGLYLAASPDLYRKGVLRLLPIAKRQRAGEVLDAVDRSLCWWLVGRIMVMAINGTLTGLAMWILGIPLPFMLGLLTGLLHFIPNIGAIIASVPAILLGLMAGGPMKAVYVIAVYVFVQNLEGFVLTPLVQQKTVSLPPALIILSQLLMGMLFGTIGVLLATPMLTTLIVLIRMLYVEDILGDRAED